VWTDDDIGNVADWGIRTVSPADLRTTTQPLLDGLAATGCSRVAVHFNVDTIDSNENVFGARRRTRRTDQHPITRSQATPARGRARLHWFSSRSRGKPRRRYRLALR
jgi:hypothetical protein